MTTVLVDAENVRRSRWPNVSPDELADLCRRWADGSRRQVIVVFDRQAPGGLVGERALDRCCEIVGTGDDTADAYLHRRAKHCHAHRRAYWLVTSDRGLRALAGAHAERVVGGGSFVRELMTLA